MRIGVREPSYDGPRGTKRHYYKCNDDRPEQRRKAGKGHAPYVRTEWIEDLVWADVKRFLQNPGEVLQRLREQAEVHEDTGALQGRRDDLKKRLRATQAEKDRYVKLYGQGHLDAAELDTLFQDVNVRANNLRLLLDSVEAQLSEKSEHKQLAENSAAWLATLRGRVTEVEADTEEAFSKRRELVKLLVESIIAGRDEEGKLRVEITYRFGPPTGGPGEGNHDERERSPDVDALSNPQGWAWPKPRPDGKVFTRGVREIGISPVVVHAKYLLNLASPDPEHRERSTRTLAAELAAAGSLNADLVVHAGSHGGSGEQKGTDRLVEGLTWARELAGKGRRSPWWRIRSARERNCALRSTPSPTWQRRPGRAFAWLRRTRTLRGTISPRRRVPVRSRSNSKRLLGERIALLHLNDPRNGLGSHRDGHERIGEGQVPMRA